ncbi:hypothetical protein [Salipiger marinus]|uniref:hypothetical protein n=1 Tax=Salipiger marinus TaxID=555512 RepID=UPI0010424E16|nr:hypothetical protein [Salipiger marinus]
MCLSVYLGSHEPIQLRRVQKGSLGIEAAKWTPPALSSFPFRYYLGRQGDDDELECSCLLAQHVEWNEHGPKVRLDELYFEAPCPFNDLRDYVSAAQRTAKPVVVACDDSGGIPQECSDEDYDHLVISVEMIAPTSFLFAAPLSSYPWRILYLAAPGFQ